MHVQGHSNRGTVNQPEPVALRPASSRLPALLAEAEALDRMRREVLEALNASQRRGLEIGGVLLGRVEPEHSGKLSITIKEFVTVGASYDGGPSYSLSGEEMAALRYRMRTAERVAADGAIALGWWRSDTLDEPLRLRPEDEMVLQAVSAEGPTMLLLIRPNQILPFRCQVHVLEDEVIDSHSEFLIAFDRRFAAATAELTQLAGYPYKARGAYRASGSRTTGTALGTAERISRERTN